MAEFEFLRYVTIGQYLPTGSFIHRLDPRIKLVAFAALVAAVAFSGSYSGNVVALAAVAALVVLARVPFKHAARGVWPVVPILVILALFQVLIPPAMGSATGCRVLFDWSLVRLTPLTPLTDCTMRLVIVSALRLVALIILTTLLTFTTSVSELARGTERLLSPFSRLGLPAHELSLMVTIALRFVPFLAGEMERIAKAQVSRGADFGEGSRWRFLRSARQLLPLLVPLILNSLRRGEELALAMEARCYVGGVGRTHLVEMRARPADFVALGATLVYAALLLGLDLGAVDRVLIPWLAPAA
jgi:energy-coupling factor transport system permease protein